ncbi:MAG: hypothetical protein MUF81_17655 [Verrucomicrobia bacterium]|jgi:hypothetical protein|nr:hypothetical protein [Verrucomicrobiota bacterium]
MEKPTSFEQAYFLQTRQEIDTEKRERDTILNIAVAVLGGLAFGFLHGGREQDLERINHPPLTFLLTLSGLLIVTSLMWVRKRKMQQIADRWFVLRDMAARIWEVDKKHPCLESLVYTQFTKRSYQIKDAILAFVLATPFYSILFFHGKWGRICICLHALGCALVFLCPLKNLGTPPPLSGSDTQH